MEVAAMMMCYSVQRRIQVKNLDFTAMLYGHLLINCWITCMRKKFVHARGACLVFEELLEIASHVRCEMWSATKRPVLSYHKKRISYETRLL